MATILGKEEIQKRLPHRFENLVLDECTTYVDTIKGAYGDLKLTLSEGDTSNRDIFLVRTPSGKKVFHPLVYMEVVALASVSCTGTMPAGYAALFAGIQRFQKTGDIFSGAPMSGRVSQQRTKGDFYKYEGLLSNDRQETIAKGEVLAIFMDVQNGFSEAEKKEGLPIEKTTDWAIPRAIFPQTEALVCVDSLVADDPKTPVFSYRYPTNHPFVKGHFPNTPIMMGIMQWGMVLDGCLALSHRWKNSLPQSPRLLFKGNAEILKEGNTYACEIKQFSVVVTPPSDTSFGFSDMIETQRILFRDTVLPGDTLYCRLNLTSITPTE